MNYLQRIRYSEWIDGSGWRLTDAYAGIDDIILSDDEIDDNFANGDFAELITEGYCDDDLRAMADADGSDYKYEYTLTDEDGNLVKRIELWMSDAARYRLGDEEVTL